MTSYRELISFVWEAMKGQRWVFLMVLVLDCVAWPFDALIWPYILHWVIDTFDRFEANRAAALAALLWPIIAGIALVVYMEVISRIMGFSMAKAMPRLQTTLRMRMF